MVASCCQGVILCSAFECCQPNSGPSLFFDRLRLSHVFALLPHVIDRTLAYCSTAAGAVWSDSAHSTALVQSPNSCNINAVNVGPYTKNRSTWQIRWLMEIRCRILRATESLHCALRQAPTYCFRLHGMACVSPFQPGL